MTDNDHQRRERWIDVGIIVALSAMALAVHPVGYLLDQPYWADEAWVAVLSRAPLSQWVPLSASVPLGWLFLVRLVPGPDALRVLPLFFAVGQAGAAYLLARGLAWRTVAWARVAGVVTAAVVVLAPASLIRHDLKQYTADGFFALVILALGVRFDTRGDRRTLVALAAVGVGAAFFSTASIFVTVAVFAGLVVVAAIDRDRRRLRPVLAAALLTGLVIGGYGLAVLLRQDNAALRAYWIPYYLTGGPVDIAAEVGRRFAGLHPAFGMPALLFLGLVVAGVAVFALRGRRAAALVVPVLWAEMIVLGRAQRYPFLNQRTSHFLLVLSLAVAGIGATALIAAVHRRSRAGGVLLAVTAALGLAWGASGSLWAHSLPVEDARSQVRHVAENSTSGDVILVDAVGAYAFSFYWPGAERTYTADTSGTRSNGFRVRAENGDGDGVVYASGRSAEAIDRALSEAVLRARERSSRHLWVIRTHQGRRERAAWIEAIQALGLPYVSLPVGAEALVRIDLDPAPPAAEEGQAGPVSPRARP